MRGNYLCLSSFHPSQTLWGVLSWLTTADLPRDRPDEIASSAEAQPRNRRRIESCKMSNWRCRGEGKSYKSFRVRGRKVKAELQEGLRKKGLTEFKRATHKRAEVLTACYHCNICNQHTQLNMLGGGCMFYCGLVTDTTAQIRATGSVALWTFESFSPWTPTH